jgi:hypothetical protein
MTASNLYSENKLESLQNLGVLSLLWMGSLQEKHLSAYNP